MAKIVQFKVRLHIISPVHIGCDDAYEPTGFVVDKAAKKLIAFDPLDFVRSLNDADRTEFLAISDKGTLESNVEIYKFMNDHKDAVKGHSVSVSNGFIVNYDRVVNIKVDDRNTIQQELNKFFINRTGYLPFDNAPYIPGSALKGALRTGWLNHINNKQSRQGVNSKQLEQQLLGGSFATDPFRLLKVSDFLPVGVPETRICFGFYRKRNPKNEKDNKGPPQILEVIQPYGIFEGIITLHQPEIGADINNALTVSLDFFKHVGVFFESELNREEINLQQMKLPASIRNKFIEKFEEHFLKSVFPVRIGRHSGAECLTIEGARSIYIMHTKYQQYRESPTTIWFAADAPRATNNLHPFGWAALELLPMDSACPYPLRTFTDKMSTSASAAPAVLHKLAARSLVVEQILWKDAVLGWNPGSTMLSVTNPTSGQKAELRLNQDRSIVSEDVIARIRKGKVVKADVSLQKSGNAFAIVAVKVL